LSSSPPSTLDRGDGVLVKLDRPPKRPLPLLPFRVNKPGWLRPPKPAKTGGLSVRLGTAGLSAATGEGVCCTSSGLLNEKTGEGVCTSSGLLNEKTGVGATTGAAAEGFVSSASLSLAWMPLRYSSYCLNVVDRSVYGSLATAALACETKDSLSPRICR